MSTVHSDNLDQKIIELLAEYAARTNFTIVDGKTPTDAVVPKFRRLISTAIEGCVQIRVIELNYELRQLGELQDGADRSGYIDRMVKHFREVRDFWQHNKGEEKSHDL